MDDDKLIIYMDESPPIRIVKEDWPIIASVTFDLNDRDVQGSIIVRQNVDGRALVYVEVPSVDSNESIRQDGRLVTRWSDIGHSISMVGIGIKAHKQAVKQCIDLLPPEDV